MANLEAILAETNKSYDNSRKALNDQINAISGDLNAQKERINAQYAQQGKSLDNQRNWQAQASSMAASRNGGSFGGKSEIANKKYYQQQFVPAVTQMNTNQSNDLSSAESQANQNRLSLEQTLAGLNDEASRYAMQRYDAAVAAEEEQRRWEAEMAEKRRQFNEQMAAQREANSWLQKAQEAEKGKTWNFGNGYQLYSSPYGDVYYSKDGKTISAGEFIEGTGSQGANWDLWHDVWNSGASTTGVGSDTVAAFDRKIPGQLSQYNYLWR